MEKLFRFEKIKIDRLTVTIIALSEVEDNDGQLLCVYTKDNEILYKKFDSTTEMCCNKSGTYNKSDNQGQRLECCGASKNDATLFSC